MTYDSKQKQLIHQLIQAIFSDEELDEFCRQKFPGIAERFTDDMNGEAKTRLLIETCAKHQQLGNLVVHIKNAKPEAYQNFVDNVERPPKKSRQITDTHSRPAPATITTFPVAKEPIPASSSMSPVLRTRSGEVILNADTLLSQSLAGRYQIEEVLDKSGLGAVFKAYDTKLDMTVAIKVIDLNRVKYTTIHERVRQEVRTAMQLDHPGIVKVYDFGQSDSLLYIIMEYIPGYNLRQARQYFKTIDSKIALPQVIRLFREICLIVDFMHQQRILHPGTKPENIMLKQGRPNEEINWRPVLINLGLLRPNKEMILGREEISPRRLTYTVSPEFLLGHGTDIRSDVYTLGVLLYDLAAGQAPFHPKDISDAVRMHVETSPPPPRSINPDISEDLEQVILKALAKNPADRYLGARSMAQALEECLDALSLPAPLPQSEVTITTDARALTVTPGEKTSTVVTLRNNGKLDDYCQVRVDGIPEEWVSISPSATTLSPGHEQDVELIIQPPRAPQSRAGRHTLAVQIMSQYNTKYVDEVKKVLAIAPYSQFSRSLWPKEIATGQTIQVTADNQGNAPETVTIRPKTDRGLSFNPDQERLKIAPGESGAAEFRVSTRRQLWIASDLNQTYSIEVITPTKTDTLSGQVSSKGALAPKWAFIALMTIFLLICAITSMILTVRPLFTVAPTATVNAQLTRTAQASIAQASATLAGTATIQWLGQDTDNDGLLNSEELQLGTDPNNPDTDGDTLPDGAEVKELNTNPTRKDSDFDGIPDDEEVKNILNPESRDTDADGTPDAFDEFPGQPPTATPASTTAPTATPQPRLARFTNPQPFLTRPFFSQLNRYQISEDAGAAVIEVELTPAANQQIQTRYQVESGNATPNLHYRLVGDTVIFNPGDTRQTFRVEIIDNSQADGDKLLFLVLRDPSPGVQLDNARLELLILDNE